MTGQSGNRQAIIKTAKRLITDRGIDETSLADIAKEARISKGTLYYYYSSKQDLIFDIAEQHIDSVTTSLTEWVDAFAGEYTPQEMMLNVLNAVLGAELRGRLHLYLVQQAITSNPQLLERFNQKYASWKSMIEERLESFLGVNDEQSALAIVILAVIDGLLMQTLLGADDIDLNAVAICLAKKC